MHLNESDAVSLEPHVLVDKQDLKRLLLLPVQVLDDVYKTTVDLIADKYANDEDKFPARSAAIALFEAIEKKGWHGVRLSDVTGLDQHLVKPAGPSKLQTLLAPAKTGNRRGAEGPRSRINLRVARPRCANPPRFPRATAREFRHPALAKWPRDDKWPRATAPIRCGAAPPGAG